MHRSPPAPSPSEGGDAARLRSRSVLRDAVDLYVQAVAHDRAEIRAFGDLVDGLLADVGPAERRHVSERLAERGDVPLDLARRLAMDVAEVAAPMIVASPVLTSSDLVQIMRLGADHVRLVTQRLDLGADLAAMLIDSSFAPLPRRDTASLPPVAASTAPERARPTPDTVRSTDVPTRPLPSPVVEARTTPREAAIMPTSIPIAANAEVREAIVLAEAQAPLDEASIPHFRVPLRGEPARTVGPTRETGDLSFLDLDGAGRWQAIQIAAAEAAVTPAARVRAGLDHAALGERLFVAAVARDLAALTSELGTALDLDPTTAARVTGAASGAPLAVALAALGVDARRATSILVLMAGEAVDLEQMRDLAAMAGMIGRRTAERIVLKWRGDAAGRLRDTRRSPEAADARRVLDTAERREAPSAKPAERGVDGLRAAVDDFARRIRETR